MRPIDGSFLLAVGILTLASGAAFAAEPGLNPVVAKWLSSQTNMQTWSADFVQTRALKSLSRPLTATGHVWFAAPNRFRWELGNPAQTIALRTQSELVIVYPRLKRVERFPLTGDRTGPWRDALALLETGFPRSEGEIQARYNILSQRVTGDMAQIVLQPKVAAARRIMPQIKIEFSIQDSSLRATELEFADGSEMRNDFRNALLNPKLEEGVFVPEIPPDFKIVEPGQGGSPPTKLKSPAQGGKGVGQRSDAVPAVQ